MRAELDAVEHDGGIAVHRVEMQEGVSFEEALFHREFEAVAQLVVGLDLDALGETRKQALGRVGHQDLALPAGEAVLGLVDGVVPPAVERLVAVTRELRARIFRKRNVGDLERSLQSDGIHNPSVIHDRAGCAV